MLRKRGPKGPTKLDDDKCAEIVIGAMALGGAVPLPDKVNSDFAGVYQYLRTN
ncbi:MAG: hypothetical protein ACYDB3_08620 [Acidimicrobiales bacterium]